MEPAEGSAEVYVSGDVGDGREGVVSVWGEVYSEEDARDNLKDNAESKKGAEVSSNGEVNGCGEGDQGVVKNTEEWVGFSNWF